MRSLVLALALVGFFVSPALAAKKKPVKKAVVKKKPMAKKPAAPRPPPGPPQVLFTFDDGPAGAQTVKVLDLLDQYKVKAVFFVNGMHFLGNNKAAERNKEILREELKRGHVVGNHTVHHYFLCGKVYVLRAEQEIEDNAKLIEAAVGIRPPLFRTPFGAHCAPLKTVFDKLKITPIGWDLDPQDWKLKNAQKIEATVINQLKNMHGRNILLLHDIQPATVEALPKILAWIQTENADRKAHGRPEIEIIDYNFLLHPETPPAPPPPTP